MTHLTMEQLLALREPGVEPGTASQREHMEACEACRLEFERLEQRSARLRALPTLRPARDQWPRVAGRLNAVRRQRRIRWMTAGAMALAASLALALLVRRPAPARGDGGRSRNSRRCSSARGRWKRRSAPTTPMRGCSTGAPAASRPISRIASPTWTGGWNALNSPGHPALNGPDVMQLWQERVGLLDALVDVHVTRASNVGL